MKDKLTTIILFFIMLILIGAIVIFGLAIYFDIASIDENGTVYVTKPIETAIEGLEKNNNDKNVKDSETPVYVEEITDNDKSSVQYTNQGYFYLQLNNNQRQIYNGLYANKENMMDGIYQIDFGDAFTETLKQDGGQDVLSRDYQSAVEAFLYDNPDVFYIDANKLYLNVKTTNKIFKTTYNVYIGSAADSTYYVDGFTSLEQIYQAKTRIERVRDSILSKLTGNTYKDILKIHDYLVDSIDYDKNYSSIGTYSVYGALIDKKCVCEGYAKSLKYLLNAANIPCEIVQGTAKNSSNEVESHAWNCVKLNDKWYYMDVTWDDPIIIGSGYVSKSIQYKYFLKGQKSMRGNHILSHQFSENGKVFRYPECSSNDYK